MTSKHNEDEQYIWESDGSEFKIMPDPRGNTLQRGTTVSLFLKEEAKNFLEESAIQSLVKKYSQFINFPIYLWNSRIEEEEVSDAETETEESTPQDAEVNYKYSILSLIRTPGDLRNLFARNSY